MYKILRSILFLWPAEKAHYLAMDLLALGLKIPVFNTLILQGFKASPNPGKTFLGIHFPNRIGLAAGFDKNAKWLPLLKELGFGHVEVGTVTPKPQEGNPKPRLFRLKKDQGLINRMGFNNEGLDAMVERLKNRPAGLIVGGNIGKNKVTPNENAIQDYLTCYNALCGLVDYVVVNVSSPNTPGLRELQDKTFLTQLFAELHQLREQKGDKTPILLKIAPDLANTALDEIIETVQAANIEGLIATNTTVSREHLKTSRDTIENIGSGGLSGKPVFSRSNEILRYLRNKLGNQYPIIGVGGVLDEANMSDKLAAGADLVQVYTGFIYSGPWMVKKWAAI